MKAIALPLSLYVVKGLGWPTGRVGLLFLFSAPTAAAANYLSGRLSDRVRRKRGSYFGALAAMTGHACEPRTSARYVKA
jgi:hypothetical protein